MKILMATMGLDIGGAETHIVELSKELKRQGHDVLIASNGGVYVKEIENAGIKHISAPMNRRSILSMVRSCFIMRRTIKREKPDIVHAHARIPGFICGLLRKTMKFPFVTTAHWVFSTEGALRFLTNWGEKTVAVSEDIKQYLKDNYNVEDNDIFVTINGIDTEKFSPNISGSAVRCEFAIPEYAPVISHVSRIDESRALAARILIDIAPQIASAVPDSVILIAGGGDVFDELHEKAQRVNEALGRRCVIMTGPRTDINEIVAAGDIFVGVSRAALEAMAASKPTVIAGNEGYMGVFTEDKLQVGIEGNFCCRGCPIPEGDTMLRDITELMTKSDEEKKSLGDYARQVVMEHYSVERMAADNLRAYRSAIPGGRIVLSGYYGFGNAGDEAILESVIGSIRKIRPEADITVLSKDPESTEQTYRCKAVPRFNPWKIFRAVRKCDVLISGGGSLLQDATSTRSLLYYTFVIRLAKLLGKKVMLYANGIGPVSQEKNREKVRKAVECADAVTLRDPQSLNELRDMGVERTDIVVACDPVFLLEPADEAEAERILKANNVPNRPFMTVSVRPWEGKNDYSRKIADICDKIYRETGIMTVFIPMQPEKDRKVSMGIAKLMKSEAYIIKDGCNARQLMAVIGKGQFALTMRLHSLIFAARMTVPAVGFSYDPKTDTFLKLLGQPCVGDVLGIDENAAINAVRSIIAFRGIKTESLVERRYELTNAALRNEEIFRNLCDK